MPQGTEEDPETPQPSHASAIPDTVEERVRYIVGLMERLEWQRGKTSRVLAELWGLAVSTVEGNAAEASRRIVASAEDVRRDITLGGGRLLREALQAGDAKAFGIVGKLLADVSGANAPQRSEVLSTSATPAEAARLVREVFGGQGAKPVPEPDADEVSASPSGG
jgi:hypothetical protein